jgi:hypothetical protein
MKLAISIDNDFSHAVVMDATQHSDGSFTAALADGKIMSVEAPSGKVTFIPAGSELGEYEHFIIDGNVAVFYSKGQNPQNKVWRFGATKVREY